MTLLMSVPLEHQLRPSSTALLPSDDHSVLGLRWSPATDDLALTVRRSASTVPTKRAILSQTARLFDPLGWLAPIIVRAKLLIQTTWLQRLEWDAPLAPEEATSWTRLEEELPLLEDVRVPRWFHGAATENAFELHRFSNASERAYAAVIYVRIVTNGEPRVSLVIAKTKVAPLRRVSLPRLELCAAALLSSLANHVRVTLGLSPFSVHLWTDSTVTLSWIRGHPARWTTFVANRVAEIQRTSQDAQRHVPGRDNPADCASRGVSPKELLEHPLWWEGPRFLKEDPSAWPENPGLPERTDLSERRPDCCLTASEVKEIEELTRFSSFRRLLRVSAWMWRWRQGPSATAAISRWIPRSWRRPWYAGFGCRKLCLTIGN